MTPSHPELGAVCLSEMLSAIGRITRYPEAWPLLRGGLRRCRTRRFPYGLMYCADGDEIVIVAIADLHREPTYWRYRMRADTDR